MLKEQLLSLLKELDENKTEYPEVDLAEIADKLQDVLENIQEYLLK